VGRPPAGEEHVFPSARTARRPSPFAGQGRVVASVALGGALGALARYALALALPTAPGRFPLATFLTNVLGGLLIGVLVVVLTELTEAHPLLRPLLVTGVLGGFTTFSTYAVDIQRLVLDGRVGVALAYLAGTLLAAVAATWVGLLATRALARWAGGLLAGAARRRAARRAERPAERRRSAAR
jgi:fluoride exporter